MDAANALLGMSSEYEDTSESFLKNEPSSDTTKKLEDEEIDISAKFFERKPPQGN